MINPSGDREVERDRFTRIGPLFFDTGDVRLDFANRTTRESRVASKSAGNDPFALQFTHALGFSIVLRWAPVRNWPFLSCNSLASRLGLDPVDDQLRKGVAIALQHQHVAVAGDTKVAEVDEVGFSSVGVEPIDDRFVYPTRVTEVVCAGQDQHGFAAKLAEIRDAQLAAGDIAPFQH